MRINNFDINISDMPTGQTIRKFTINGQVGAEFEMIVLQNPSSSSTHTLYYDFNSGSFESGHNDLNNNLRVVLTSVNFNGSIIFPSGGGDFVIKLIAINGTEIARSTSSVITRNISKAASNATITFTPGTTAANAGNYATLPTSTSTGAVNSTGVVSFDWDITNSDTDAKSHGFIIPAPIPTINDTFWYFEATENVLDNPQGNGEDTGVVEVADLTGIAVGMDLIYYKGTTAPELNDGSTAGNIRITGIDTAAKTITFNSEVGFDEGQTMTFRAYGSSMIDSAIGLGLSFGDIAFKGKTIESTLRDDSDGDGTTSTTVRLGATGGIAGGAGVTYIGEGVNNSSTNTVTSVTPDPDGSDGDGAMVVTLTQVLKKGTLLKFNGSHKIIDTIGTINISKYPATNATIYLDLELLIQLGTNGL
tara:strand:+ start:1155 stop:2411 length:1257 start_codon:yes stop_codon:yes gene_type:complete